MKSFKRISLAQHDANLDTLRKSGRVLVSARPRAGWIKATRQALGMTGEALAKRLGLSSRVAVYQLESSEANETITLASLRRAANALDADLIYAIVPRRPLSQTISARARAVATQRISHVAQTMALEDQTLTRKQIDSQIEELADQLEREPSALWR